MHQFVSLSSTEYPCSFSFVTISSHSPSSFIIHCSDAVYRDKSIALGHKLLPAFSTASGMPLGQITLGTARASPSGMFVDSISPFPPIISWRPRDPSWWTNTPCMHTVSLLYLVLYLFICALYHHISIGWSAGTTPLAEAGTLQLEFFALTRHSGNQEFKNKAQRIIDVLDKANKPKKGYVSIL